MEIAWDVEEAMQESQQVGGSSFQNNTSSFRYQGGSGVVLWANAFKSTNNMQVSTGIDNNVRMRTTTPHLDQDKRGLKKSWN